MVTSNDVIIFGFYTGKKGKTKVRNEMSFLCGLYGMSVEIPYHFKPVFKIVNHEHYVHASVPKDFANIEKEFASEAKKDLALLREEIISKKYSKDKFAEVLKQKTRDEILLMSKNFYRSVLFLKLFEDNGECFWNDVMDEATDDFFEKDKDNEL